MTKPNISINKHGVFVHSELHGKCFEEEPIRIVFGAHVLQVGCVTITPEAFELLQQRYMEWKLGGSRFVLQEGK